MDPDPDEEAVALVGDLVQAARVPAKRRAYPVQSTVARLAALAYEHGLRADVLGTLVADVLAVPGGTLDLASVGALVRNLYPAGVAGDGGGGGEDESDPGVAADTVVAVVGCLGHGQQKPPLAAQALLLRWLILVFSHGSGGGSGGGSVLTAGGRAALFRAYAVLFNLLDTAGLRAPLCHLLALLTRRRHVRPFRIQAILNLARQTGHDPHLLGLLRVFKNYYPEVIVGEVTRGRASPFKHPDPAWRARLDEIRRARLQQSQARAGGADSSGGMPAGSGFRVRGGGGGMAGAGRGGLPPVHTLHAQEASVTLEEVDGAAALAAHLERLELPSQLVAVLADPLLQKLLRLRPAADAAARVDQWLDACVASAAAGDGGADELLDLVEVVHDYVASTRTFPPVLHRYFAALLARWDGRTHREHVLGALAHVPAAPAAAGGFAATYAASFRPLEARLLDNTAASQLALLAFYTRVLQEWGVVMAAAGEDGGEDGEGDAADEEAEAAAAAAAAALPGLVDHVNGLVLAVLQNGDGATEAPVVPVAAALAVLDLYEEVAAVLALRRADVLASVQELLPPAAAVYVLHFHGSAAAAARLYGVLAAYKRALEAAMGRRPARTAAAKTTSGTTRPDLGRPLTEAERARVNVFNGYLMDVCNCLWRARAFSTTDTNALGCRVDAAVVARLAHYMQTIEGGGGGSGLAAAFSLSLGPTLCLQALAYLRSLEEAALAEEGQAGQAGRGAGPGLRRRLAGPVTQAALAQLASSGGVQVTWQAFRAGLLVYLQRRGLGGVAALMYNTMKNLMSARASEGSQLEGAAR